MSKLFNKYSLNKNNNRYIECGDKVICNKDDINYSVSEKNPSKHIEIRRGE